MIIATPDDRRYGAASLAGVTQPAAFGAETARGVLLVKAAFDLVDSGGIALEMRMRRDSPLAQIVYSDGGTLFVQDGEQVLDVTYEADIALEKSHADIVVEGHMPGADPASGLVLVGGAEWLRRTAVGLSRDTARNLFGWQPRMALGRAIAVDEDFEPDFEHADVLPPQYNAHFNNVHRRGDGFTASSGVSLPPGALVEIFQTTDQSDTAFALRLPDIMLTARLRSYCGHGPDAAPYWRITPLGAVPADTLIVSPDAARALMLWRLGWPADLRPADTHRKIEIFEEAA